MSVCTQEPKLTSQNQASHPSNMMIEYIICLLLAVAYACLGGIWVCVNCQTHCNIQQTTMKFTLTYLFRSYFRCILQRMCSCIRWPCQYRNRHFDTGWESSCWYLHRNNYKVGIDVVQCSGAESIQYAHICMCVSECVYICEQVCACENVCTRSWTHVYMYGCIWM